MPLAKPLPEIRHEMEQQLAEGNEYLPAILKQLQDLLPEGSEKRNTAIALLARLNDANKKALRQTISNDDLQVEYNAIRADLLDFITGLTEADFDEATASKAGPDGEPAPKQGNVLYRIPRKMPVLKETECVVRIAISEDAIVENITLDQSVVLKDLKRVSDVMQVELADPAKEPVFKIRTTSEPQQLITDEGFTEWFFYVEPVQSGVFPLEIKVAVLEMALNNVYRKEIVFRETVEIVTDGTPPEVAGAEFKKAGAVLNFQNPPLPGVAPESTPAAPQAERSAMSKAGAFLATAAIAATGYIAFFKPEIPDWYWARYAENTKEAYAEHINKFPNSPYREEAFCHRAALTATLEGYREYLKIYPEGKCGKEIEQALKELENKQLEEIRREPTAKKIIGFINDFPDSRHLDELMQIAQSRPELKTTVWDEFENIYWEALQKFPAVSTVRTFLKTFPATKRLPELKRIAESDSTLKKDLWYDIENAWIEKLRMAYTVPDFRSFLAEFPNSERWPELKQMADSTTQLRPEDKATVLSEIESALLQAIQRQPSAPKILEFLTVFPESQRLPELKHLVDTLSQVKSEVLPALENAYWQKLIKAPDALKISEFLREFPTLAMPGLLELKKIVEKNRQLKQAFLPEIKNRITALQPKRPSVTSTVPTTGTNPAPNSPGVQEPATPPPAPPPATTELPRPPKPNLRWVQGGVFDMGCTNEQSGSCGDKGDEKPVFDIKIGSYSLGKYEVTFEEYDLFCDHTRRAKPDDNGWGRGKRPVINISWFDAVDYCNWLSQQHGFAPAYVNYMLQPGAKGYRLPTEAEWEYAARGGSRSQGFQFAGSNVLDEVAWNRSNSGRTQPVGTKKGNELQLEDMSGNVLEWCSDWYGQYVGNGQSNPHGPESGTERVLRSSSWTSYKNQHYLAARRRSAPSAQNDYTGFRLARD